MKEPKINARDKKKKYCNRNAFDGLISRLDLAEERISELEGISIESSKTEKQREQGLKKTTNQPKNRIFKGCGTTTESMTCGMDVSEGKEEKNKRYLKQ